MTVMITIPVVFFLGALMFAFGLGALFCSFAGR